MYQSTDESKAENRKMISAYEKMLKDGTAFKEVDMTMHTEPSVAMAEGGLGERVNEQDIGTRDVRPAVDEESFIDENTDFSAHDDFMQQRIDSLRRKMGKTNESGTRGNPSNTNKEIISLKKRVAKLEEALMLIMETHEKLLG